MDEHIVELIVWPSFGGMMRKTLVLNQNTRLQPRPVFLPDPCEFKPRLSTHAAMSQRIVNRGVSVGVRLSFSAISSSIRSRSASISLRRV